LWQRLHFLIRKNKSFKRRSQFWKMLKVTSCSLWEFGIFFNGKRHPYLDFVGEQLACLSKRFCDDRFYTIYLVVIRPNKFGKKYLVRLRLLSSDNFKNFCLFLESYRSNSRVTRSLIKVHCCYLPFIYKQYDFLDGISSLSKQKIKFHELTEYRRKFGVGEGRSVLYFRSWYVWLYLCLGFFFFLRTPLWATLVKNTNDLIRTLC